MKRQYQIGQVSYLNACPLGHGLEENSALKVHRKPPSQLCEMLNSGRADVALVPVVDYLANRHRWRVAVPYGICSKGKVWTVRIFSPVPLDQINEVTVDVDSHTSVQLTRVLFKRIQNREPRLVVGDFSMLPKKIDQPTLLIGDKAWRMKEAPFIYDLGELWYQEFHLPFVLALWVSPGEAPQALK